MTEEKKTSKPLRALGWFKDIVENVPRPKGDSFADKVVDIESAKLITGAGKVAMNEITGTGSGPSAERGVSQGLENAGRKIVENKLLSEDPITSKVLGTLGDVLAADLKRRLTGGSGLEGEDSKELAERRRADELGMIVGKVREELIEPLAKDLQTLSAKIDEKGASGGKPLSDEDAITMVMNAQERAKEFLKKQGYSVESVSITREQTEQMIKEERAKQTEREAKLKEDWEKESGAQVEIEKQRIVATEGILTNVFDRVFDVFLEPIKQKIQQAIDQGAFRGPGA